MSLRMIHLAFILLAIVGADLFGLWAVNDFVNTGDATILALGVLCLLGGIGLVFYAVRTVRMFDRLTQEQTSKSKH